MLCDYILLNDIVSKYQSGLNIGENGGKIAARKDLSDLGGDRAWGNDWLGNINGGKNEMKQSMCCQI